MKKFKLYATVFAALCFAASCQDDVIDSSQGQGNGGDGTPAYLTVSFTANAESSTRAAGDTNTGDSHGTAEDSGHENAGTTDENKVETALIVVVPADQTASGSGFAQLYTVGSSDDDNMSSTSNEDAELTITQGSNNYYSTSGPIEIAATDAGITYNVLVVVNPAITLTTGDFANVGTGISDLATVRSLYSTIINGNYAYNASATTNNNDNNYKNAAAQLGNGTSGFMMANQAAATVTVKTENTIDNPAKPQEAINVERVLSKITFRPNTATETNTAPNYVYKTQSSVGTKYQAKTEDGAYNPEETETQKSQETQTAATTPTPNYRKGTFNVAKDLIGQDVYVLFSENEDGDMVYEGVYRKKTGEGSTTDVGEDTGLTIFTRMQPKTETEYNTPASEPTTSSVITRTEPTKESKEDWFVVKNDIDNNASGISTQDILGSITYQMDEGTQVATTNIYVKIEGYALINLSKNVNYVRHTTKDPNATNLTTPFGTLTDNATYLWTPYWAEKNAVTFDAEGNFSNGVNADTWFYNTLADVSTESKSLKVGSNGKVDFTTSGGDYTVEYFKAMPTNDTDGHNTGVSNNTNVNNTGYHDSSNSSNPNVGYLLDYCYENSVIATQQRHGLTTGICFVATMWKNEACNEALETLYRYAGNLFSSIKEINDAYSGTIEAIKKLADKEGTTEFTKEELEEAGIERYESNICYYYTTEIKHYDNNMDDTMGVMEFAIMRNNIYSLAITAINDIGDPFIDPTPGTEDETKQAYMTVQAQILPWIVRYNDIEF